MTKYNGMETNSPRVELAIADYIKALAESIRSKTRTKERINDKYGFNAVYIDTDSTKFTAMNEPVTPAVFKCNHEFGSPECSGCKTTLEQCPHVIEQFKQHESHKPPRFTEEEALILLLGCKTLDELRNPECGQVTCKECKLGITINGHTRCLTNLMHDIRRKYS